jgi:NADPH2:quinone reductase
VDTVGGPAAHAIFEAVRDGGRYSTAVPPWWIPGGPFTAARGIDPFVVGVEMDQGVLADLATQVANGTLEVRVAEVLPLGSAAEAHRRMEAGGTGGKLVLQP